MNDEHGDEGQHDGPDAALNRVLAERGAHGAFADRLRLERGGQAAGAEDVDEVVDFLLREVAGDLALGA